MSTRRNEKILMYLRNKSFSTKVEDHDLRYFIFELLNEITKGSFLEKSLEEQKTAILSILDSYRGSQDLVNSYSGMSRSKKLDSLNRLVCLVNDFYTLEKIDEYNKN